MHVDPVGPAERALAEAQIPLHEVGKRWKFDPPAYWRLKQLIETCVPLSCTPGCSPPTVTGASLPCAAACPTSWPGNGASIAGKSGTNWPSIGTSRDAPTRSSPTAAAWWTSTWDTGFPAEKFEVIPNGIEPPRRPSPKPRAQVLDELGLPANAQLIGAVGRLWPQKGYKDLIWAAELLKVVRNDTHLVIIGEGPQYAQLLRWREACRSPTASISLGTAMTCPHCCRT